MTLILLKQADLRIWRSPLRHSGYCASYRQSLCFFFNFISLSSFFIFFLVFICISPVKIKIWLISSLYLLCNVFLIFQYLFYFREICHGHYGVGGGHVTDVTSYYDKCAKIVLGPAKFWVRKDTSAHQRYVLLKIYIYIYLIFIILHENGSSSSFWGQA